VSTNSPGCAQRCGSRERDDTINGAGTYGINIYNVTGSLTATGLP
jgi:hypothetical protein